MRSILVLAWLAGCHQPLTYTVETGPRDWSAHPAIVSLPASTIYAVSDIHGGYDRFVALLVRHGVIAAAPSSPELASWSGGTATLIVVGDLIDKGPDGLEVVDLLRALQVGAATAGGAVVVTLGNHEAEFFADPSNAKAEAGDGIDAELSARGVDLVAVASGADPRGLWLRQQPFAARIGTWFFAHGGNTGQRPFGALDDALRTAFDTHDFQDAELIGDQSLLEARDWYTDAGVVGRANEGLGVSHTVFGHDPNALGPKGTIATDFQGALFRIDCGMSPGVDYSHGALLRIRSGTAGEVADELDADGTVTELWHGPG